MRYGAAETHGMFVLGIAVEELTTGANRSELAWQKSKDAMDRCLI